VARQYKCVDCKRGFKSQFALTAHIRFCKESKTAKCPECNKSCNKRGLATHRYNKHGVAGTSRWSIRARKAKKPVKKPAKKAIISGSRIEFMIRENLQKPFFQDVLKEWAMHVECAAEEKVVDATTFANLYLEMMRDPRNDEARQGCAAFATFMNPRNWRKILEVLRGAVDKETLATFEKPEAEAFYKQFKKMIIEQITEYWGQFLQSRVREEAVEVPQSVPTWKDQAIKAATDKIEFHNAEIKRLEAYIQVTKELP
jgi:DNA-directed RNA polymerase subunit RPC12/RpoP